MSLADEIVKKNTQQSPNTKTDELGIPVPTPETPEYLVARTLLINEQSLTHNEPRIHGLHTRNGELYRGTSPLKETKHTIYDLTHLKRPIKEWEEALFWRELKRRLPQLYTKVLEVSPDLYWDMEQAALINRKEAEEKSKNG